MYVKRVRRKCSVRACRRTDSFALSKSREFGNSIIVCRDCLEAALKAIAEMNPAAGTNAPKRELKAPPPLFFNAEALGLTGADEGADGTGEGADRGAEASGGAGESAEAEADTDTDKVGASGTGESAEAEADTGADADKTGISAAETDGTGEAEVLGGADTDEAEASDKGESAKANGTGKAAASETVKAGGSGEHTCSYCGKKYASSAALKRHESKCAHEEE